MCSSRWVAVMVSSDDDLARFQKTSLRARDFAGDPADRVRVAPHLMARKNFGWSEEIQSLVADPVPWRPICRIFEHADHVPIMTAGDQNGTAPLLEQKLLQEG